MREKIRFFEHFIQFIIQRKAWTMVPLLFLLLTFGLLAVFMQASPLAPLLYTVF